jgi:ATP-dependent Lon protease
MTVAIETPVALLPLSTGVVLPNMVVTIALETDEAQAAAEAALATEGMLLLVPRTEGRFASVGVLARIETAGELPTGQRALVVRATSRARLGAAQPSPLPAGHAGASALFLNVTPIDAEPPSADLEELAKEYRLTVEALFDRAMVNRAFQLIDANDPSAIADGIVYWPELTNEQRIELLETVSTRARLELALSWVRNALAESELREKIRADVSSGMEKQQRDFLLRQQMAAIRKELGETEQNEDAIAAYRARAEAMPLPEAVRESVNREIGRLERMSDQSPEQGWVRSWLDTILDIPWGTRSTDRLDVMQARSFLDADTTGLAEGKDRIIEWLAVRSLRQRRADTPEEAPATAENSAPGLIDVTGLLISTGDAADQPVVRPSARRKDGAILMLVGPPGVGKTSLGESMARALNRSFVRIALGGVRDEAEIRGHRRTYVGSQAGRIVRALREAKTMNPVILLDEIDKLTSGWSGDPAAALLEVLDPAQNHTFRDHYLEVDLDLSDVVFVATANTLDSIPGPLRDRLEIISVDGYTDQEKVAIARNHLLPNQLESHGLSPAKVSVSDEALLAVIEGYTAEAGVRGLERQLAKVMRKVAVAAAGDDAYSVAIASADDVVALLGKPKRQRTEVAERLRVPGVATGLAVTGVGGDVLFVEATSMPGTGSDVSVTVTGQLGDVMQESAQIALSYVRANAERLGIDQKRLEGRRLHIHFPAGAVPKDGPSAGITMTTALVSLLTDRQVRSDVAMTGEITLHGQVLPIGGVKQKLLAAKRAGVTTVIIPKRNEDDLDEIAEDVRAGLTVFAVSGVDEVLDVALV